MSDHSDSCRWCGQDHEGVCPRVKSILFYPSGEVKRVEFRERTAEDQATIEFVSVSPVDLPAPRRSNVALRR